MRPPTGSAVPLAESPTLIATPKLRCGATTSSISPDNAMRSNGSPADGSSVSLARMPRQRCACSRNRLTSSANGEFGLDRTLELGRDHRDGGERRAELMRGRGGEPVELGEMLLAREHELGGGKRVGQLPRFFGQAATHARR